MPIKMRIEPSFEEIKMNMAIGISPEEATESVTITLEAGRKNPFRNGEKSVKTLCTLLNSKSVVAIASGKELALVRSHMKNLKWPIHDIEPVIWTGEDATFIALNFEF